LEGFTYELERTLRDAGEKVPVHEKSRSEQLIEDARKALQDETTAKERYHQLASDLQQALHMVTSAVYGQAEGTGGAEERAAEDASHRNDEEVIDAEYTEQG
jgi:molecular chaperone DnaK